MRVLLLAAHPDDEVIGAGGTLLRHRAAGDVTTLVVATVAYTPRWPADVVRRKRAECLAAAELLGVPDVRFLEFRTMHLNALPAIELNDAVGQSISDVAPDVVYAPPCGDLNRDHAVLFEAALVATRPAGRAGPAQLYSYEIPTTTRYNVGTGWQANTYVDVTEHMDAKLAAMAAYETELREPPHPRSLEGLRIMARERGAAVGLQYAEAHMLVREVRWRGVGRVVACAWTGAARRKMPKRPPARTDDTPERIV
ncbi:MAG: PIG-L family deacetylase [Planctomycetes bacterium]|nr:PIG-L family deacetylase [Planctomycetota bacterium]